MANDKVTYDLDAIKTVAQIVANFKEAYGEFTKVGLDNMRAAGPAGGDKGKMYSSVMDTYEEKFELLKKFIGEVEELLIDVLKDAQEYSEDTDEFKKLLDTITSIGVEKASKTGPQLA